MSFDVFLNSCENGGNGSLRRQSIADAFEGALRFTKAECWEADFGDAGSCDLYVTLGANPNLVTSFSVNRPIADVRLWDSLFRVMQLGHVVLYYPGCSKLLVASEETAKHLPSGMADALGGVAVVRSGQEISDRIRAD
jgi:hypothetical protein